LKEIKKVFFIIKDYTFHLKWIPAFAGMTMKGRLSVSSIVDDPEGTPSLRPPLAVRLE